MKINDSLVKNYLVLFSRYHSDYCYFKHGMEYFMWNFYISSVKKRRGVAACMYFLRWLRRAIPLSSFFRPRSELSRHLSAVLPILSRALPVMPRTSSYAATYGAG